MDRLCNLSTIIVNSRLPMNPRSTYYFDLSASIDWLSMQNGSDFSIEQRTSLYPSMFGPIPGAPLYSTFLLSDPGILPEVGARERPSEMPLALRSQQPINSVIETSHFDLSGFPRGGVEPYPKSRKDLDSMYDGMSYRPLPVSADALTVDAFWQPACQMGDEGQMPSLRSRLEKGNSLAPPATLFAGRRLSDFNDPSLDQVQPQQPLNHLRLANDNMSGSYVPSAPVLQFGDAAAIPGGLQGNFSSKPRIAVLRMTGTSAHILLPSQRGRGAFMYALPISTEFGRII